MYIRVWTVYRIGAAASLEDTDWGSVTAVSSIGQRLVSHEWGVLGHSLHSLRNILTPREEHGYTGQ